jgi:4-hydroxy-tetrahydrodipicolinate synthase
MKKKLEGVLIAMPTPLTKDEDIDINSLLKLIDHCITQGAKGIMILGTMGEGAALTDSQRQILLETTISHTAGRIPILATASGASTRKTIEYAKAADVAGADFIVCTTPFYYKFPDQQSAIQHIQKIGDNVNTPLIFYNAAGFTGNNVSVDTTEKILNMSKVAGIKDSSGNYGNFVELLRRYPDKSNRPGTMMQGDESVFDASLLMGADGIISGGGVCFLKSLVELYKAALAGDKLKAMEWQRNFFGQLMGLLLPDSQRNWMYNIKKKLVDMEVISNAYCTAPFMTDSDSE